VSKLLLAYYGDDFTGSTDALEQLTLAGIRTALFVEAPSRAQLKRLPHLQAVGVAGMTRSMTPRAMERELRPALKKLKALSARHVHYKICSTFDSSPRIGSIGRVIEVGADIFRAPFVPLLVAVPALGRFTVFGTHFARYGIGTDGEIHRLDRHPSISKHPVTPMMEADLRVHLARQTKKKIALFDLLNVMMPVVMARSAFAQMLVKKPDVVLFDAVLPEQLAVIGRLIDAYATEKRPLFSVGSSGIEMALGTVWSKRPFPRALVRPAKQVLVGSGSCSPVTEKQIGWALKNGFAEIALDPRALAARKDFGGEIQRAIKSTAKLLASGRSVIVHTTRVGSDKRVAARLKHNTAKILGTALGRVLRGALEQVKIPRLCIAGGDTASFAARALGVEALEMIAPLTPGAPLCRAFAADSPADGLEFVFKGGQVGAEDYFGIVKRGKI
jgi:3-oxoisoapionate kinase